ncbi:MAG TPA: barstar family protein [Acidobacteriaceae bacterium]|nr:barstar family protein [Acidobacteriaceae bacterium]
MREIVLVATEWRTVDDFYDSFFRAVGAPSWHGRNFDALNDSIGTGDINQIEVPYRIAIRGLSGASADARTIAMKFEHLVNRLAENGCPVEITVERN